MGNRRIPSELMTFLHRCIFVHGTHRSSQSDESSGLFSFVSSSWASTPSRWQLLPSPRGAGSVRSLGYCQKILHGSSGQHMNDYGVCCCSVLLSVNDHSTDVFIVHLGKQTKRCQGVKGPPVSPCQRQGARRMPRRNNGKPLWSGVEYPNLPCAGLPGCVGCSHWAVGMTMLSLICPAARAAPGTPPLWAALEHVDPGEDHNTLNKEGSWLQERQ